MSAKPPECYTTDVQADCLRVEISPARSLLLPFNQFAFSELTTEDKQQKLRLVFATHEVLISGHALRRIETVMQRMELALIMKLPDKYRSLASESQPIIRDIVVTEGRQDDAQQPAQN
jgi:hypothetical protein